MKTLWIKLICLGGLLLFGFSFAPKNTAIEVNYLNVIETQGELRLDAEIVYELNDEIKEALANGIPLTFQVKVRVVAVKNWRWDSVITTVTKIHVLRYHALSKQYILEDLETGNRDSYPDLRSVLAQQGNVLAMHIAKTAVLEGDENHVARLRARMLSNKLPLPLRMKSYFFPKWRLSSGWYEWPL